MDLVLIGAGGHAKALVSAVRDSGHSIVAYADLRESHWLDRPRVADDPECWPDGVRAAALGLGGVSPAALEKRLALMSALLDRGVEFPPIIHASAAISNSAQLDHGAIALTRSVIHPDAKIGPGVIVNTGAIVEHDSEIAAGAHIAPACTILGGVKVGECSMLGAGAIVLPGVTVSARSLVPAGQLYPAKDH